MYAELQRKIEVGEAPYDSFDDEVDDGPPFEIEWQYAERSLETLGLTCVSMLSASLQLYFMHWEKELGVDWRSDPKQKTYFKNGFLRGYKRRIEELLKYNWTDSGVDIDVLEQVIMARNRGQHPNHISNLGVQYTSADREKFPLPFFLSDTERAMLSDAEMATINWLEPSVHVSRDNLFHAIEQTDALATWLEKHLLAARSH